MRFITPTSLNSIPIDTSLLQPLAWTSSRSGKGRPCVLITCSQPGFAVFQSLFRLEKQEKGNSSTLLGAPCTRMALAITAMISASLCFLPSVTMCQHCLRCVVARLARLFSCPCIFHVLFCMFHVLFYSKCGWLATLTELLHTTLQHNDCTSLSFLVTLSEHQSHSNWNQIVQISHVWHHTMFDTNRFGSVLTHDDGKQIFIKSCQQSSFPWILLCATTTATTKSMSFNKPTGCGNMLNFIQINTQICERIPKLFYFSHNYDLERRTKSSKLIVKCWVLSSLLSHLARKKSVCKCLNKSQCYSRSKTKPYK